MRSDDFTEKQKAHVLIAHEFVVKLAGRLVERMDEAVVVHALAVVLVTLSGIRGSGRSAALFAVEAAAEEVEAAVPETKPGPPS